MVAKLETGESNRLFFDSPSERTNAATKSR